MDISDKVAAGLSAFATMLGHKPGDGRLLAKVVGGISAINQRRH